MNLLFETISIVNLDLLLPTLYAARIDLVKLCSWSWIKCVWNLSYWHDLGRRSGLRWQFTLCQPSPGWLIRGQNRPIVCLGIEQAVQWSLAPKRTWKRVWRLITLDVMPDSVRHPGADRRTWFRPTPEWRLRG